MDEKRIKALAFPDKRTLKDLDNKTFNILTLVPETAKQNGVYAELLEYNSGYPSNPRNGLYFIVTPDFETMNQLRRNIGQFENILDAEEHRSPYMMNCYYNIVPLNDLNVSNVFSKHQDMCGAIQDMAIVANAFFEYGLPLPKEVHQQTIENFYEFNHKRNDHSLPENLRKSYDRAMKKMVMDAYQFYGKEEALSSLPTRLKDNNRVSEDYFLKNHIETIYESIDKDFFDFIAKEIPKHPEFKYYKSSTPELKLKDMSKISDKVRLVLNGKNPWENKVAIERYYFGFPKSCEALYYGWMVEYNTRNYDKKVSLDDLQRKTSEPGLSGIYVDQSDMWNFNSLCRANNIEFAVDSGRYKPVTMDTVDKIMVCYRPEDKPIIKGIVERLSRERRGYSPVNSIMKDKAQQNKPANSENPYIEDKYVNKGNNVER